jgi:tryptophanyl-tRNA synthetase
MSQTKKRILTGDRPTGRLHLGHYVGTLANRVALQGEYESFFIVADLHTLTTRPEREHIAELHAIIRDMVLDYLSLGIDPERSTIYLQSAVPEVSRLALLLGNLVSVPRLARIPSLKEMARAADLREMPFGLLGYPVLQAADILLPRAHLVPVGRDNEAHVEVTREIARRFNATYGETFPIPEVMVGDTLMGTDGGDKMSKSLDNTIFLSDGAEAVERKVRGMYTDPARTRADIPGRVEGNPVFAYHRTFNDDQEEVMALEARYRAGAVGDVDVKRSLAAALNRFLAPIRTRRASLEADRGLARRVLYQGTLRMREEARRTMALVMERTGLGAIWAEVERSAPCSPSREGDHGAA